MITNKRRRELYQINKEENPEMIKRRLKKSTRWQRKHRKETREYHLKWQSKFTPDEFRAMTNKRMKEYRKNPWIKTYYGIMSRLRRSMNLDKWGNGYRCYVGIKNFLTPSDLKSMWESSGAAQMIKPSIDRIDADGNYTVDNCRYIELSANVLRRRRSGPIKGSLKKD